MMLMTELEMRATVGIGMASVEIVVIRVGDGSGNKVATIIADGLKSYSSKMIWRIIFLKFCMKRSRSINHF